MKPRYEIEDLPPDLQPFRLGSEVKAVDRDLSEPDEADIWVTGIFHGVVKGSFDCYVQFLGDRGAPTVWSRVKPDKIREP